MFRTQPPVEIDGSWTIGGPLGAAVDELRVLESEAVERAHAAERQASVWTMLFYLLGVPATLAAAAGGATALAKSEPTLVAIVGFVATVLVALQTFLRPDRRVAVLRGLATDYEALMRDVRAFRDSEIKGSTESNRVTLEREVSGRISSLNTRLHQLDRRRANQAATDNS